MGSRLSFPATNKRTSSGGNNRLLYSTTEMQGWRLTMEDAVAAVLSLDEEVKDSNAFFAVYDGHGGRNVADFASVNVHKRLVGEDAYREKRYQEALKRAFLGTDEDMLASPTLKKDPSGCTAVAALMTGDGKIYVANAGDSRSILSVKGEVKPLSFDHVPTNETERARIVAAGGYVDNRRVNGRLALSRALGDFELKRNTSLGPEKQPITADPDVTVHDITEEDEFLVIASDGIWECLVSQRVIDFVRLKISEGKELGEIGEMLFDYCMAPDTTPASQCPGCRSIMCYDCDRDPDVERISVGCDNMSVVIVAILNGRTKEEWYTWVTDRVKQNYGYKTPKSVPELYSQARLAAFRERKKREEERRRAAQVEQEKKAEQDRKAEQEREAEQESSENKDSSSDDIVVGSKEGPPAVSD